MILKLRVWCSPCCVPPDRRRGSATPFFPQQAQMFEDATVYRNRVECSGWLSRTLAPCLTPEKVRMACGTFLFLIRAYNTVTAEQIPLSDVMCFYRDFEAVLSCRV